MIRIERAKRVEIERGARRATDGLHLDTKRIQQIIQACFEDDETSASVADARAHDDTSAVSSDRD
jgi:hypothetical protein